MAEDVVLWLHKGQMLVEAGGLVKEFLQKKNPNKKAAPKMSLVEVASKKRPKHRRPPFVLSRFQGLRMSSDGGNTEI